MPISRATSPSAIDPVDRRARHAARSSRATWSALLTDIEQLESSPTRWRASSSTRRTASSSWARACASARSRWRRAISPCASPRRRRCRSPTRSPPPARPRPPVNSHHRARRTANEPQTPGAAACSSRPRAVRRPWSCRGPTSRSTSRRTAAWPCCTAGVSLQELVDGLNALGVGPRDMINILQAIKAAGALQADIELM